MSENDFIYIPNGISHTMLNDPDIEINGLPKDTKEDAAEIRNCVKKNELINDSIAGYSNASLEDVKVSTSITDNCFNDNLDTIFNHENVLSLDDGQVLTSTHNSVQMIESDNAGAKEIMNTDSDNSVCDGNFDKENGNEVKTTLLDISYNKEEIQSINNNTITSCSNISQNPYKESNNESTSMAELSAITSENFNLINDTEFEQNINNYDRISNTFYVNVTKDNHFPEEVKSTCSEEIGEDSNISASNETSQNGFDNGANDINNSLKIDNEFSGTSASQSEGKNWNCVIDEMDSDTGNSYYTQSDSNSSNDIFTYQNDTVMTSINPGTSSNFCENNNANSESDTTNLHRIASNEVHSNFTISVPKLNFPSETSAVQRSNLKRHSANHMEGTCSKKKKKAISFDKVSVFYFPRTQGFTCIPSEGGSTLGMSRNHTHCQTFSLEEAADQRHVHKNTLTQPYTRSWSEVLGTSSDESDSDELVSEPDNDSDNAENAESCNCLQPLKPRDRRVMLRAAGIRRIDSSEKDECDIIRESREYCGCSCQLYCDSETCTCAQAGIKCQVDRINFPCSCTRDGCVNPNGRIEFNPIRVRTHYMHTVMRLALESRQVQAHAAIQRSIQQYNSPNIDLQPCIRTNNLFNFHYQNNLPAYYQQQYNAATGSTFVTGSCFNFSYNQFFSHSSPAPPLTCQPNNHPAIEYAQSSLYKSHEPISQLSDDTNGQHFSLNQSNYRSCNQPPSVTCDNNTEDSLIDFADESNSHSLTDIEDGNQGSNTEDVEKQNCEKVTEDEAEDLGEIIKKSMIESVTA